MTTRRGKAGATLATAPNGGAPGFSPYLTEQQFSERYHVSPRTAQRWRSTGDGPPFVRLGPRRVLYRLSDCEAWAASRTFAHRAEELARPGASQGQGQGVTAG
ncbi:MAG: helix-turn-helix domain-containing protein [Acetobacteraceae bacterium]|nr:helix-turn-helix domain-containing protein [Acetobacteraceae bacterium]